MTERRFFLRLPGMEIGKRAETPQSSIEHFNDDNLNLLAFFIPGLTPYQVRGRLRNPGFPGFPLGEE